MITNVVNFLVVARGLRILGDVRCIYESRADAEQALADCYKMGADSGEIYACTLLTEPTARFIID